MKNEEINYLLGYESLKIFQHKEWFNFSLDSVLLPNFILLSKNTNKVLDLGTGNAPIPLILSTKTKADIYGVEIQEPLFQLAKKSVELNNLTKQITILNEDIKNLDQFFEAGSFDVILSNPPYFKYKEKSIINVNNQKSIARHEILINLDDIMRISSKLLKDEGVMGLVHRPERLLEIFLVMKKYNIEPKRIRFIFPKMGLESNMVLIEGRKRGKSGLKVLTPLYVHDSNGQYTDEIKAMFC